jgi:hypothetical protein
MPSKRRTVAGCVLLALLSASCTATPEGGLTSEDYDRAIRLGAEWFLNNQDDRFLHYEYDVEDREYGDEEDARSTVAMLRYTATLWSVAKAANYVDDPRLHELAQRGFAFFESHFERDPEGRFTYLNVTPGWIPLGYSAFMILALLEMEHPRRDEYLEQFANGILSLQQRNGELRTFFFSDSMSNKDFFPGEALLALMSLYEETREERILDTVKLAFLYYRRYWNEGDPEWAFANWHIQAYERLHDVTNYQAHREFVYSMADELLEYHEPEGDCSGFEFHGVFVGARVEGINRAYELARDHGDARRAECYGRYIREASEYLVGLQLTDTEQYPAPAIGGFPDRRDELRVDRNQHVVTALIDARLLGAL